MAHVRLIMLLDNPQVTRRWVALGLAGPVGSRSVAETHPIACYPKATFATREARVTAMGGVDRRRREYWCQIRGM